MVWKDELKASIYLDDVVAPIASGAVAGNLLTLVQTGLTRNTNYYYTITAVGMSGSATPKNLSPFPIHTNP